MARLKLSIDHIGILGPSIEELVLEMQLLGFSIVGPAELTAVDASGKRVGLGQRSAHIMFADDYVELTAVDLPAAGHHLEQFLHPPWGIRLLLLSSDDIEHAHAQCRQRRLEPGEVQRASRHIDYGQGGEAGFRWFGLPPVDWPDALVAYVEHLTRERVFDPGVCEHPNGALNLTRLYYRGADLADRYRKLDGTGPHNIEIVKPGSEEEMLGFRLERTTPFTGVGIGVQDIDATAAALEAANIDVRPVANGLSAQLRSGVCIVFEPGAESQ